MKNKLLIIFSPILFLCCKDKKSNQPSGDQLYTMHACHTCHSLDGSQMIGPSFKDIYGKKVEFTDGTFTIIDDEYLIESILDPSKNIVKNFPNLMGSYKLLLNEKEIAELVEFIKRQ